MTASEYFELPDPTGGFVWELHFGELVKVAMPVMRVYALQRRISDLIEQQLGCERWVVGIEMPYGLVPGNDVRRADVGAVFRTTWDADPNADVMIGSPDIVVQVKSDRKMEEDAILHITHGASAIWLVKAERREIVVITASSRKVYGLGDTIPLPGIASLSVADILPV